MAQVGVSKIATRDTAERVTLAKSNKIEVIELRCAEKNAARTPPYKSQGWGKLEGWRFARRYLHF